MKYFTQEWYKDIYQKLGSCWHIGLDIDDRASEYSDSVFKSIYSTKKQEYVDLFQRAHNIDSVELLARVGSLNDRLDIDKVKEYEKNKGVFPKQKWSDIFDESFENKLKSAHAFFPPDVAIGIPDMRVLALGVCTKKTKRIIRRYYATLKWDNRCVWKAYQKYYESIENSLPDFGKPFDLDVSQIDSIVSTDDQLMLHISRGHNNYLEITKVTLSNYKILEMDDMKETECVAQEIYLGDNCIEVHILSHRYGEPRELCVKAQSMIIE